MDDLHRQNSSVLTVQTLQRVSLLVELMMDTFHSLATLLPIRPSLKTEVEEQLSALFLAGDPQLASQWTDLCELTDNWKEILLSPNDMCLLIHKFVDTLSHRLQTALGNEAYTVVRYLNRLWIVRTNYSCVRQNMKSISHELYSVSAREVSHGGLPLTLFDSILVKMVKEVSDWAWKLGIAGNAVEQLEKVTTWVCLNFRSHLRVFEGSQTSGFESSEARKDSSVLSSQCTSQSYSISASLDDRYAKVLFPAKTNVVAVGHTDQAERTATPVTLEMRQCLEVLQKSLGQVQFHEMKRMLARCATNIIQNPTETRFRQIRTSCKVFQEQVWRYEEARQLFFAAGFLVSSEKADKLFLPDGCSLSGIGALQTVATERTRLIDVKPLLFSSDEVFQLHNDSLCHVALVACALACLIVDVSLCGTISKLAKLRFSCTVSRLELGHRKKAISDIWTSVCSTTETETTMNAAQAKAEVLDGVKQLKVSVEEALAELFGRHGEEACVFSYFVRVIGRLLCLETDIDQSSFGEECLLGDIMQVDLLQTGGLPLHQMSGEFVRLAVQSNELHNALVQAHDDAQLGSNLKQSLSWIKRRHHTCIASTLTLSMNETEYLLQGDASVSIAHAVSLAEQLADACAALHLGNSISEEFSKLISYSFNQLGICDPIVTGMWQQLCYHSENWQQLDRFSSLSRQLWEFTNYLYCELLSINVDHAHLFGVTRSVNLVACCISANGGVVDWLTEICGDLVSGEYFTPGSVACFFLEPVKSKLKEMEEINCDSNEQLEIALPRLISSMTWCRGKFHEYLKPASSQDDALPHPPRDQQVAESQTTVTTASTSVTSALQTSDSGAIECISGSPQDSLTSKKDQYRRLLEAVKCQVTCSDGNRTFNLILRSITNILDNPSSSKYRRIKTVSSLFKELVWCHKEARQLYLSSGFLEEKDGDECVCLLFPMRASLHNLECLRDVLQEVAFN